MWYTQAKKTERSDRMDITFPTPWGRFNYRVCAVIADHERLLVMQDETNPYFYLPGGRVALHERAQDALLRELREELMIDARIVRPLWLNEAFFTEEVSGERYHELCLYFLVDVSGTGLPGRGEGFVTTEGGAHRLAFSWMPFGRLRESYLYPEFIKEEIFHLPDTLTLCVEDRRPEQSDRQPLRQSPLQY